MKKDKKLIFNVTVIILLFTVILMIGVYKERQNKLFASSFYKPVTDPVPPHQKIFSPAPLLFTQDTPGYISTSNIDELKELQKSGKIPFKPILANKLGRPVYAKLRRDGLLYIAYFDKKIPMGKTFNELVDLGVVIIEENPLKMTKKEAEEMYDASVKSMKKIGGVLDRTTINGFPAVYGGNIAHVVSWYNGRLLITISANKNVPFPVMFEMAKSMRR